jgi:hypothetical protein
MVDVLVDVLVEGKVYLRDEDARFEYTIDCEVQVRFPAVYPRGSQVNRITGGEESLYAFSML